MWFEILFKLINIWLSAQNTGHAQPELVWNWSAGILFLEIKSMFKSARFVKFFLVLVFFFKHTVADGFLLLLSAVSGRLVPQTPQGKPTETRLVSGSLAPVPEVFIRRQPCARLINDASHKETLSPSPEPPVSFSLVLWNGQIEVTPKLALCHKHLSLRVPRGTLATAVDYRVGCGVLGAGRQQGALLLALSGVFKKTSFVEG